MVPGWRGRVSECPGYASAARSPSPWSPDLCTVQREKTTSLLASSQAAENHINIDLQSCTKFQQDRTLLQHSVSGSGYPDCVLVSKQNACRPRPLFVRRSVGGTEQIVKGNQACCLFTCPPSLRPQAQATPSVSMATMNSEPHARCTTLRSFILVTITGHFCERQGSCQKRNHGSRII